MEHMNNVDPASLSNPTYHTQFTSPDNEDKNTDTESILSLVNVLEFNVDEKDKEQFFSELEYAMSSELFEETENYQMLIDFFIKHTNPNGKISA